jgi:hypothetical protein
MALSQSDLTTISGEGRQAPGKEYRGRRYAALVCRLEGVQESHSVPLHVRTQGDDGVDARGAASRKISGKERYRSQDS